MGQALVEHLHQPYCESSGMPFVVLVGLNRSRVPMSAFPCAMAAATLGHLPWKSHPLTS